MDQETSLRQRDLHPTIELEWNCTLLHTRLRFTWHGVLITSAYKWVYCAIGTGVLCNLFWCVKLSHKKYSTKTWIGNFLCKYLELYLVL